MSRRLLHHIALSAAATLAAVSAIGSFSGPASFIFPTAVPLPS